MKNLNKKIALVILGAISVTNLAFASIKTDLTSRLDTLNTKYSTLKTDTQKDLKNKVTALNTSYSNIFTNLGYDDKVIEYLESLGKLNTNFKENLLEEYNTVNTFIAEETTEDTTKIASTKNTIDFDDNITDSEKTVYSTTIDGYEARYNDLKNTIDLKISALETKYENLIKSEKSKIQGVVEDNLSGIKNLDSFLEKYNKLTTEVTEFKKLYKKFNDTYLAYSSDLTALINTKEQFYVDLLNEKLTKINTDNIKTNSILKNSEGELTVYKDNLVKNFKLSLKNYIDEEYFVLYSKKEIDRILENYDSITTKFVDSEGKIRSNEVINDKNAFEQLESNSTDLKKVNDAVKAMMDESSTENTLENMKIKIENKIIGYYNDNFVTYLDDLRNKISEKLNLFSLQNTDGVIVTELLGLKYENLYYRVIKDNEFTNERKEKEINKFLSYINQYRALKNTMVDAKINGLFLELETYKINKKLDQSKFDKYMSTKEALIRGTKGILDDFDQDYGSNKDGYRTFMDEVLVKIDKLMESDKLSTKWKFTLLVVKLALIQDKYSS